MISVILIASNASAWIERAIKSVIDNTYRDWEMVVVDNGSTDNSREIAERYAHNDLRIRVHTIPHTTLGGARHAGVKLSKHQWITMLNATDTLEPGALQWLVDHIPDEDNDTSPVTTVVGGIRCHSTNGSYAFRGNFSGLLSVDEFIQGLLRDDFTPIFGGKLLRRAVYPVNDTYLDSEVEYAHELIALIAKMQPHSHVYINTNEYIYNFYPHLLDKPSSFNFRGWLKATNMLEALVPDNEAFFLYRLNQLYSGCIVGGSVFQSSNPAIKKLRADARKYDLGRNERRLLRLTRSRSARKREARRHPKLHPNLETLISIIMVAHNAADSIAKTVKSIQRQTLRDWELIIIDDFSTDRTSEIVRSLATNDQRLRLITNSKYYGRSQSRIMGVNVAKGDYIGFISPDDRFMPQALQQMWSRVKATGADLVLMGSKLVSRLGWLSLKAFNPDDFFDKPVVPTVSLIAPMLVGIIPHRQCDKIYKRTWVRLNDHTCEDIIDDTIFNMRVFSGDGTAAWTSYCGLLRTPTPVFDIPYNEMLLRDIEGYHAIERLMDRENWANREIYLKKFRQGISTMFIHYVSMGLKQSWREGLQRMLDESLHIPLLQQALEENGISPDTNSILARGRDSLRRNKRRIRFFRKFKRF